MLLVSFEILRWSYIASNFALGKVFRHVVLIVVLIVLLKLHHSKLVDVDRSRRGEAYFIVFVDP